MIYTIDNISAMNDPRAEVDRLEAVATVYDPSNPEREFDYHTKRLHVEVMRPFIRGRHLLEMGCATGELTSLLVGLAERCDVVEGSIRNIEIARGRIPQARYFHALWEEFTPTDRYSDIVLNCALEHVEDPVGTLSRAKSWIEADGTIHIVVPNADSLHRLVGVEMGILETRRSLSASDVRMGHRRVYDLDHLLGDVRAAGLVPLHWQGVFLKVVSNEQMLSWKPALIHALHEVGQRFPTNCAQLYVVARAR
jgi:trans-aconitate methyltransferase